jgi:HEPN domain-containing protein
MRDIDTALNLLQKANNDLTALIHMQDEEAFSEEIFGFHLQQAVEKSLKAWLSVLGILYPKTHDLNLLVSMLEKSGQDISAYENFVEYNVYAVQFRYEDIDITDPPLVRSDCIQQVKDLIDHVENFVNQFT